MRIWETFDYTELLLMVGWEFGSISTSTTHTTKGRYICPSKTPYVPHGHVVSKDVLHLRVSSYSGSRHAKNELSGFHLYFHSTELPIHVAIHPTDTRNNFHLSFSDEDTKTKFLNDSGIASYALDDFLEEDKDTSTTPRLVISSKASHKLDAHFVPFLAKHLQWDKAVVKAHLSRFTEEIKNMMNHFYKNRRVAPFGSPKHHPILELPYYPKDIERYVTGKV